MMHNSPSSHHPRHYPLAHHPDPMIPAFPQQPPAQQAQPQQHHPIGSQPDLPPMYDEPQPQPAPRKRGGRGPGKKDADRPSISVRWEEGDLTERLIQALERQDRQWHAVIAQVGPEHTRVVIGVPKRDLQREIARHLFANDTRYNLEDKRTIEALAVSVKNKLFKIVNLYQDCERELGEWQGSFNDEREIAASPDPNVAAAWGRVKEKLPQFFRVRELVKRTQTGNPPANPIPTGQTSPTRATTVQNPQQSRAATQAPTLPSPQTPRHPASGSLGESSSATRPSMQPPGHGVATLGLNLSGQHSPATRTFVQQGQQHAGNMPYPYAMPGTVSQQTSHLHHTTAQQQMQQQQYQQQQVQQHHSATQRLPHQQHPSHGLSIQHPHRAYGGNGPTSASAPSPSFAPTQNALPHSPALPPPGQPIASSSSQRPPSRHRAPSIARTSGPTQGSPSGQHSSSPSPPPSSPPMSAETVIKFLEGYESRKRKREEDWVSLKRMRYEERERERQERERQRQHEREMMRMRIELARVSQGESELIEGEGELDHLGLRDAPG